jgi:hypothetical protein
MKILHTSDWHIGRLLYGRNRYDEFSTFLDWLAELINKEGIHALLNTQQPCTGTLLQLPLHGFCIMLSPYCDHCRQP